MSTRSDKSIPSVYELGAVLHNPAHCLRYLLDAGILPKSLVCACGREHSLDERMLNFRCGSRGRAYKMSVFSGTIFSGSHLSISEVLYIGYQWLTGASASTCITQLGHSSATICSFYGRYRRLVAGALSFEDTMIGGDGIEVDVDESKFGRRKNNRGHRIEGVWVLGGVGRTAERKLFLVPVESRSAEVLLDVISRHVREGSIVNTDLWRGYSALESILGLQHNTVNHSLYFRYPLTGVHTNYIEATWRGIKLRIPIRNRVKDTIESHLIEYIWRRKNETTLWKSLLEAIRDVEVDDQ
jgi:hypothetical protein